MEGVLSRSLPANPAPPPPPAPPCTVEMLKQRPAGDKSWPIACSDTTLGNDSQELDLSGAHLSYGDFKEATFTGKNAIKLNGVNLTHADLSGLEITLVDHLSYGGRVQNALIDFAEADLTNADLSGSKLSASAYSYSYGGGGGGDASIDFTRANLANANLSNSELTADGANDATIDFSEADLASADLSGSALSAEGFYGNAIIDFTKADLTNADLSGTELKARAESDSREGDATIDFTEAKLANADLSGWKLDASAADSRGVATIKGLPPDSSAGLKLFLNRPSPPPS